MAGFDRLTWSVFVELGSSCTIYLPHTAEPLYFWRVNPPHAKEAPTSQR